MRGIFKMRFSLRNISAILSEIPSLKFSIWEGTYTNIFDEFKYPYLWFILYNYIEIVGDFHDCAISNVDVSLRKHTYFTFEMFYQHLFSSKSNTTSSALKSHNAVI